MVKIQKSESCSWWGNVWSSTSHFRGATGNSSRPSNVPPLHQWHQTKHQFKNKVFCRWLRTLQRNKFKNRLFRTSTRSSEISWLVSNTANVFQHKQMSHLTFPKKETAQHTHLHNGQHTGNTSYAPPISWHRTTPGQTSDRQHTYGTQPIKHRRH